MAMSRYNLDGQTYERLSIIRHLEDRLWLARCTCGCYVVVSEDTWGVTKSCGCLRRERSAEIHPKAVSFINPIGKTFGKLTVVERDPTRKNSWVCVCECGNTRRALGSELSNGTITCCERCEHE